MENPWNYNFNRSMNYNGPFFVAMLDSRVNMFRWTQCFMVDQFFLVQIKMAMRYSPISTGLCLDKKYVYHIFRYTVQPIMLVWYSCVFGNLSCYAVMPFLCEFPSSTGWNMLAQSIPHRIHGAAIYGNMDPINIPYSYPIHVSIYTSTMDPMVLLMLLNSLPSGYLT